jgi:hypothetical protein
LAELFLGFLVGNIVSRIELYSNEPQADDAARRRKMNQRM